MNDNTRAPEFCGVCGTHLVEDRVASVSGYDIYTGQALSSESVSRRCPNPTITERLFGKSTKTYHRGYVLFDGAWS